MAVQNQNAYTDEEMLKLLRRGQPQAGQEGEGEGASPIPPDIQEFDTGGVAMPREYDVSPGFEDGNEGQRMPQRPTLPTQPTNTTPAAYTPTASEPYQPAPEPSDPYTPQPAASDIGQPSGAPTAPVADASSKRYGTPEIQALIKELTGQDNGVNQWGEGIDENYFTAIKRAISETPEAKAWLSRGVNTPTPEPTAPAQPTTPTNQPWTRDWIKQFGREHGVQWTDQQADYWVNKYPELEARGREIGDPGYAMRRLSEAEEITGRSGAPGGGGGGGASPALPTLNPGTGDTPTIAWQDPRVHEAILKLLQKGSTPVSGDDPAIRAQFNPTSQVIQRNRDRAKSSAAEAAFARGESSNGTMGAKIDQASGLDEAGLMGQLVGQELQGRRQDVATALNAAQGEEKAALSLYLAQLDAALRQMGLDNQNRQFYDTMGYNIGRDTNQSNQNLLALLLGGL